MQAIRSLILTLCFTSLTLAGQSPVFLWGAQSVAKPSLTTVSRDEFVKLVTPLLADKYLIVFLEDDLSNKDFLCANIADGNSCYASLQGVRDKTYYGAVENPVEALKEIDGELDYNFIDASGKLLKPLKMETGDINLLKFNDENQTGERSTTLQLHDFIIDSLSSQHRSKAFFMYTSAKTATLNRQRRQISDNSQGYYFRDGAKLLLYYRSLIITEGKSATNLEIESMNVASHNNTAMSVTLKATSGSDLTFDIILHGGYFLMKNLMYNNNKFPSSEVYAPTDFSYFCGNLTSSIVKENVPTVTLKWNSLQFQAPFGYTKNESFVFGDAWHCVGFFTGGILSGLLIVALLLTITFIGVCWMMDINTMDRFDDPKGKTITISATD